MAKISKVGTGSGLCLDSVTGFDSAFQAIKDICSQESTGECIPLLKVHHALNILEDLPPPVNSVSAFSHL